MKNFNLVLITLLAGCLFHAGRAHASELPIPKDGKDVNPLNMICKSIGQNGFNAIESKESEGYRPTRFKEKSYIVIERKKLAKLMYKSLGVDYKTILEFKEDMGRVTEYQCMDYIGGKNSSYVCHATYGNTLILNKNNLRYTITYGDGWAVYYGDSIYVEYGNCSRLE